MKDFELALREDHGTTVDTFKGIHDRVIYDLIEVMAAKKVELLKSRLIDLKIEIDLDKEKEARFKKITCEIEPVAFGCRETYYYNNGTPKGQRIITFESDEPKGFKEPFAVSIQQKYW